MRVLVTGAKGFVGRNLCETLKSIRDGKDRREKYQSLLPLEVYEYDVDSDFAALSSYCERADFVFNLAGVNRPDEESDFMKGNFGFASDLLALLESFGNKCPVMLASSVQASLNGRYEGSAYGESKLAGEKLFREYSKRTGAKVLMYRLPNLYGKWCRPKYNSVVATFCDAIANGGDFIVDDPSVELSLLYIDDLVSSLLDSLLGDEEVDVDGFCRIDSIDSTTVGGLVELLESFRDSRSTLLVPDQSSDSFTKKLHATFVSYYDRGSLSYPLCIHRDSRGSFTEVLRTLDCGQVSINISKPGVVKGNHWHHRKWEKFLVVSGDALIKMRRIGLDDKGVHFPVEEYRVSGDVPTVVEMAPGMTHSIENLSNENDLVTLIWANELFDETDSDTFFEEV